MKPTFAFSNKVSPQPWALASLGMLVTSTLLGLIFARSPFSWIIVILLIASILWVFGLFKNWRWMASIYFVLQVILIITGFLLEFSADLLFICTAGALFNWDMADLSYRFRQSTQVEPQGRLVGRHSTRLAITLGSGILFAEIAFHAQVRLGFGVALLLGFLAILGLSRGISYLRRSSE